MTLHVYSNLFVVLFQEEAEVAEGVVEALDVEEEEEVVVASVEEVGAVVEEEEVSEGAPEVVVEDLEVFILIIVFLLTFYLFCLFCFIFKFLICMTIL